MNKSIFCLFFIITFLTENAFAQSITAIGEWKSHLSYKNGVHVTQSKDKIIYSATRGIFTIDKNDLSIRFLSKENGLSDTDVRDLYYDAHNDQLIIIYNDSNIDIIKNDEIYNLPFIQLNTSIIGGKNINDFFVYDDKTALIATDFGILGFNTINYDFSFTTFTETRINNVAGLDGYFYAATENGLYRVPISGTNLTDFNQWENINEEIEIPRNSEVFHLAVKYNNLYFSTNSKVFELKNGGSAQVIYSLTDAEEEIKFLSSEANDLIIGIRRGDHSRVVLFNQSDIIENGYGCSYRLNYSVGDESGRYWFADDWDPIKYSLNIASSDCQTLDFHSPASNQASSVKFKNENAYFGSRGITEDFGYAFTLGGFYTLSNNTWSNYYDTQFPELSTMGFFNLYSLAPHPKKNEVYLGSYYNGLILYDIENKSVVHHWNKDNSILQKTEGDEQRTRIAGLIFDENENLWMANYGAQKPLAVKTKDDEWFNFNIPGNHNLHDIVIDQQGNKWIPVYGPGNGVVVFKEGDKSFRQQDVKTRVIGRNNSIITGNRVNCAAVDLDGAVWVGTDQGPIIFDCGDPFNDNCTGKTRIVVIDDIPAPLLRYEDIISIAVDGANRKWFGTRNGIFVQSPDGITEIAKYDTKNSPLLDNLIREMAFNPTTGEMFIISAGGIQSIKTETTGGRNSFSNDIYAFPNPVEPGYSGPIAIKGLFRDANVKITDINGRMVYETKALGGQAIWDGNDYTGKPAATGVYLVFSANENTSLSPDAIVTKIMIVR